MDKRILDKIKKLMALANRTSNSHEAANALDKATKLMAAHQVSQEDVELMEVGEIEAAMHNGSQMQPKWSLYLLSLIKGAFGVQAVIKRDWFSGKNKCAFIGPADRAEIAAYCYSVLARQLSRARREYLASLNKRLKTKTKTARADLFCEGWVHGVSQQVERLVPSEAEAALVKRYFDKHYASAGTTAGREANSTKRDHNAAHDGFQAGKGVTLNAGVNGASSQPERLGRGV